MIAKRINSESEGSDGENEGTGKEPSMNFETDFLYEHIGEIMKLIGELDGQVFISIFRMEFPSTFIWLWSDS